MPLLRNASNALEARFIANKHAAATNIFGIPFETTPMIIITIIAGIQVAIAKNILINITAIAVEPEPISLYVNTSANINKITKLANINK